MINDVKSSDNGSNYSSKNDNDEQPFTYSSSSSDDDNDQNERVPQGYNLRPRPIQAIQRLQVSFLKLI